MLRRSKDEHAAELAPAVIAAAKSLVKRRPSLRFLYDDFVSVGYAKLAALVNAPTAELSNSPGYVYTLAQRAMLDFARRERSQTYDPIPDDLPNRPASQNYRLPESELVARENGCLADILACCRDDTDKAVVLGCYDQQSLAQIAESLGLKTPAVSKRRKAIYQRFQAKAENSRKDSGLENVFIYREAPHDRTRHIC